MPENKQQMRSL